MKYNYTIIIPFRDNVDVLHTACKSIPDREDIQIVIIDNSTNSLEAAYTQIHKKAKIDYLTSSPTKGAGHARNCGLQKAEGNYLLFLDSDDFFTENAFEYFDKYIQSDFDLVQFDITSMMLEENVYSKRHISYSRKMKEFAKTNNEDILRYTFPTPYCKLIRHSVITENVLLFDEVKVSNDCMFSTKLGYYAKKIHADMNIAYCVTEAKKNGSLTKQHNLANWETRYRVAIDKYKFLEHIGCVNAQPSLIGFLWVTLHDFGIKNFIRFYQIGKNEKVNFWVRFTNRKWLKDH